MLRWPLPEERLFLGSLTKESNVFNPSMHCQITNSTKFFITERKKKKGDKIMKSFFHHFGNQLSMSNSLQLSESPSQICENSFPAEWLCLKIKLEVIWLESLVFPCLGGIMEPFCLKWKSDSSKTRFTFKDPKAVDFRWKRISYHSLKQ